MSIGILQIGESGNFHRIFEGTTDMISTVTGLFKSEKCMCSLIKISNLEMQIFCNLQSHPMISVLDTDFIIGIII